jgi:hypothetical protein
METESNPKVYEIIAWGERHGWAYCLNCGDRDKLYEPLYKDDFFPGEIAKCVCCGEVIRGEMIAGFRDDNFVFCLECVNPFRDEPLTEQDLLPGEKLVCYRCGKIIME